MIKRILIVIVAILFVFFVGYDYFIDKDILLKRYIEIDQKVSTIDSMGNYYNVSYEKGDILLNSYLSDSLKISLLSKVGKELMMIKGKERILKKMNQVYLDKNEIWFLPSLYQEGMLIHKVPFVYVTNNEGRVKYIIDTANNYRPTGLCLLGNGNGIIVFENNGNIGSVGYIKNYELDHIATDEDQSGSITSGYLCLNDSMIVSFESGIMKYAIVNDSLQAQKLNTNGSFAHLSWNRKDMIFYTKTNNKTSKYGDIVSYNLHTNEEKIEYQKKFGISDLVYHDNKLFMVDYSSGMVYSYDIKFDILNKEFESYSLSPGIYVNESSFIIGGFLVQNKERRQIDVNYRSISVVS